MILENATVRAAAVSTLAKFGATVDSLKVRLLSFCACIMYKVITDFVDFCNAAPHLCSVKTLPL